MNLAEFVAQVKACSKNEARRLISQNGVKLNKAVVADSFQEVSFPVMIQIGKRVAYLYATADQPPLNLKTREVEGKDLGVVENTVCENCNGRGMVDWGDKCKCCGQWIGEWSRYWPCPICCSSSFDNKLAEIFRNEEILRWNRAYDAGLKAAEKAGLCKNTEL